MPAEGQVDAKYPDTVDGCGPKDMHQHQSGRGPGGELSLLFRPLDPGRTGVGFMSWGPVLGRGRESTHHHRPAAANFAAVGQWWCILSRPLLEATTAMTGTAAAAESCDGFCRLKRCGHRALDRTSDAGDGVAWHKRHKHGRLKGPCKKYRFLGLLARAPRAPGAPGRPPKSIRRAFGDFRGVSRKPPGPPRIKPKNLDAKSRNRASGLDFG